MILIVCLIISINAFSSNTIIESDKSNTVIQMTNVSWPRENFFLVGRENGVLRRAMVHFNLNQLRAEGSVQGRTSSDAVVQFVCVNCAKLEREYVVQILPMMQNWGAEFKSNSHRDYVPAIEGDATWDYSVFPAKVWNECATGGFYVPSVVAEITVKNTQSVYEFTGVLGTLLSWKETESKNNGFLMKLSDENITENVMIEFHSHKAEPSTLKPHIIIYFNDSFAPFWFIVLVIIASVILLAGIVYTCKSTGNSNKEYSYTTVRDFGKLNNLNVIDLDTVFKNSSIKLYQPEDIEIGSIIGSGISGAVFDGHIISTSVRVALKKITVNTVLTEENMQNLRSLAEEVKILSSIAHPNIVRLLGVVVLHEQSENEVSLITEFMENGTLGDLIHRSNIELSFLDKISMAKDIAYGMHYLHSLRPRIIHRDLKPDNILLNENFIPKIADFGMSRMLAAHSKTLTMSGTPHYMAPETIDQGKSSEKTDVYSFGIILWELYTETIPYQGYHHYRVLYQVANDGLRPDEPEDCPEQYLQLYKRCISTDPLDRPDFKSIVSYLETIECTFTPK